MASMTSRTTARKRRPVIFSVWVCVWAWVWAGMGVGVTGQRFPQASEDNLYTFSTDGTYAFSYDTGSGQHQSFRSERRDSLGRVSGRFGYLDPDGALRVTEYQADSQGYRATMEVYQRVSVAPTNPLLVGPLPQQPPVPTLSLRREASHQALLSPAPFVPPKGPVLLIGPLPRPLQPPTSLLLDLSAEPEEEAATPGSVPPSLLPQDLLRAPPDQEPSLLDSSRLGRLGDSTRREGQGQQTPGTLQEVDQASDLVHQANQPLTGVQEGSRDDNETQDFGDIERQENKLPNNESQQSRHPDYEILQNNEPYSETQQSSQLDSDTQDNELPDSLTHGENEPGSNEQQDNQSVSAALQPPLLTSVRRNSLSPPEFRTRHPSPGPQPLGQTTVDCTTTTHPNPDCDKRYWDKFTQTSAITTTMTPQYSADLPLLLTPLSTRKQSKQGGGRKRESEGVASRIPAQRSPVLSLTYLPVSRQA